MHLSLHWMSSQSFLMRSNDQCRMTFRRPSRFIQETLITISIRKSSQKYPDFWIQTTLRAGWMMLDTKRWPSCFPMFRKTIFAAWCRYILYMTSAKIVRSTIRFYKVYRKKLLKETSFMAMHYTHHLRRSVWMLRNENGVENAPGPPHMRYAIRLDGRGYFPAQSIERGFVKHLKSYLLTQEIGYKHSTDALKL